MHGLGGRVEPDVGIEEPQERDDVVAGGAGGEGTEEERSVDLTVHLAGGHQLEVAQPQGSSGRAAVGQRELRQQRLFEEEGDEPVVLRGRVRVGEVLGAGRVFGTCGEGRLQRLAEGIGLVGEELETGQGEIDHAVDHHPLQSVAMGRGIHLDDLGPVALPEEDQRLVAHRLPEDVDVLHDLGGGEIGPERRVARLGETVVGVCLGRRRQALLVEPEGGDGTGPVEGHRCLGAGQATGHPDSASDRRRRCRTSR